MKNIIFYTEGGVKLGLGHIYRTLSLADQLKKNADITFLTTSGIIEINKIKEKDFPVFSFKDSIEIEKKILELTPDILIIDKLEVDPDFCKRIKNHFGPKIIIFGNTSSANDYADVVVNAIIGTNYSNKSHIDPKTNTQYLQGPRYLVLRDEFYNSKKLYKYKKDLKRIILLFGGSDQANLTTNVLTELLKMNHEFQIDVILGNRFSFHSELNQLLTIFPEKKNSVRIYSDVKDIAMRMNNSDLIITSPGTTMFEACYLRVPAIALCQNQYQIDMNKDFKLAYDFTDIKDFEKFIYNFYHNYEKEKSYLKKLQFGEGKNEIIQSILTEGIK